MATDLSPFAAPPPAFPHPPPWARAAVAALAAHDPALAGIEARAGPLPWITRARGFPGLLRAICGQRISNEAAGAVWRRLAALPGATDPAGFLALDPVRAGIEGGLTRRQVAHARALAAAFLDGTLDEARLAAMDDAAAIAALCRIPGIGTWTAEVHLLFAHARPDVFPAGDVALQAAVAELRGLPARPGPAALRAIAQDWAPHRAVAARLLWHHWLHRTGRPVLDPPGTAPA